MVNKIRFFSYLSICFIPILYGGFYISTQMVLHEVALFWLNTLRMVIATLGFLPFIPRLKQFSRNSILPSLTIGFVLFAGIIVQSLALKFTSVSSTGFLAALFVFFTPPLQLLIVRKRIIKLIALPILLSGFGYYWMFRNPESASFSIGIGEWFGIAGGFLIALHLVLTERFIGDNDAIPFTMIQIFLNLVLFIGCALIFESKPILSEISPRSWAFLIYLGLGNTVIALVLQAFGQKYVNSTVASLIIALEPVFATIFGLIFQDEEISINFIFGGCCILLAAFFAILIQNRKSNRSPLPPLTDPLSDPSSLASHNNDRAVQK